MAKHVVEKLVKYSDTAQAPRLLDALSVLCECNGVPIKKNQGDDKSAQFYSYLSFPHKKEASVPVPRIGNVLVCDAIFKGGTLP